MVPFLILFNIVMSYIRYNFRSSYNGSGLNQINRYAKLKIREDYYT